MGLAEPVPQTDVLMRVEVVSCPQPGRTERVALRLPVGATLAQALAASGLLPRLAPSAGATDATEDGFAAMRVGVWGQVRDTASALRDGDRVEIYRALLVDPKEARRSRSRRDAAGAFNGSPPR